MALAIAVAALLAVLLVMAGEAALAVHNEGVLRGRGAIEPPDDVYATMRWAYPACFVAMALEGAATGPSPPNVLVIGLAIFGVSKALKLWAISTLGVRWTFRVLVLPGVPLIDRGPYAVIRHPNYLAVVGELIGFAMMAWAPVTGTLTVLGFGSLLLRRIAVEDRALRKQ
jgi:methyltransferase